MRKKLLTINNCKCCRYCRESDNEDDYDAVDYYCGKMQKSFTDKPKGEIFTLSPKARIPKWCPLPDAEGK